MNWKGWLVIVAICVIVVLVMVGIISTSRPGPQLATAGQEVAESAPSAQTTQPARPPRIREPAVAGMFYPNDKEILAKTIDSFLTKVNQPRIANLRALISPHAGYRFSGQTAAYGYKQLTGRNIRTVIILAPSHYTAFQGASIPDVDFYRTPLGLLALSPKAKALAKIKPFVVNPSCWIQRPGWASMSPNKAPAPGKDTPHTWEHSLEVQLPFLQTVLKNFNIVPIVVGKVDTQTLARELLNYIDDKTILVASSDLSHYHPYKPASIKDKKCVDAICKLDTDLMKHQEACGKSPILTVMHIAKKKGWQAKLLDYRNSGDVTGDRSRVVGYASIAFFAPASASSKKLSRQERKFLLQLARLTLKEVVTKGKLPRIDTAGLSSGLTEVKGCFVTLKKQGKLRGCIGHIVPREPLYKAVMDNTRNAAVRDKRFTPVRPEEIDDIEIEISVLTIPQPLAFSSPDNLLKKLTPRKDGVILRIGRNQSTFLPQVWDQLPDKTTFLSRLAMKAGLPPTAWKHPQTTVMTYHVEAFKESEM